MENYVDEILIHRYEVISIINGNRNTICTTNDINIANRYYEETINKYKDSEYQVIVTLFDYDKNTNINYYDSEFDI